MQGPKPPVGQAAKEGKAEAPGVLLLDAALRPQWSNAGALQILAFPRNPLMLCDISTWLAGRVRSTLVRIPPSRTRAPLDALNFATEFKSGRRWYRCRSFLLDSNLGSLPAVVLLLERQNTSFLSLESISARYRLTPREQETLQLLLRGLSSKEMAVRMGISPNTVKAFLRLIMVKLDVSSRSGILVKLLTGSRAGSGGEETRYIA